LLTYRSTHARLDMNQLPTIILLTAFSSLVSAAPVAVSEFSTLQASDPLPDNWKSIEFESIEQQTRYSLVTEDGRTVVRADSHASASMLATKINIDPAQHPILHWQWKIKNTVEHGNVHRKDGDDYAGRLYITFDYDLSKLGFLERMKVEMFKLYYGDYPPLRAICYIWDNKNPPGQMVANPYTDRVMMFVVESGTEKLNQWITEERDITKDYQAAFGEPQTAITSIAVMTDTDNTGGSATAWYGDIWFQ